MLVHVPTAGPKKDKDGNVVRDADGHKQYYTWVEAWNKAMETNSAGVGIHVTGLACQAEKIEQILPHLDKHAEVFVDADCCLFEDSTDQSKKYSHDELLDSLNAQGINEHGSFFQTLRVRKIQFIAQILESGALQTKHVIMLCALMVAIKMPEDLHDKNGHKTEADDLVAQAIPEEEE